jgi:hypothetical protein
MRAIDVVIFIKIYYKIVPGYQKLSWSKVITDFKINNCRSICVNYFLNVKMCETFFFPHFAVMAKDFYACVTNCVGVFRETGSMNYKKCAGTVGLKKKRELSEKVLSNFIKFL